MFNETLQLIASTGARRPSASLPARLHLLFQQLGHTESDAEPIEAQIWDLWMHHPHRGAALVLDRAVSDIADQRFDIAETRLTALIRACPDYPEAWHKRSTLYYMQSRDSESVRDIYHTLNLEPRHFGALCSFGEICVVNGEWECAALAFQAALRVNPHLPRAREALQRIVS